MEGAWQTPVEYGLLSFEDCLRVRTSSLRFRRYPSTGNSCSHFLLTKVNQRVPAPETRRRPARRPLPPAPPPPQRPDHRPSHLPFLDGALCAMRTTLALTTKEPAPRPRLSKKALSMTRQPWCGAPRNNVDQCRSVQGGPPATVTPGRLLASPSGANPDGY